MTRAEVANGVWAAPGRLNLIGEHTDYNDGFVLPFALSMRTTASASAGAKSGRWSVTSTRSDERVEFAAADLVPGRLTGWAAYVAGVVWALVDAGHDVPPADIAVESDIPSGAGLSSSAALECAVLSALCDLGDLDVPWTERPALARRAENAYVGVPCGIMDQTAAMLSRAGHALFLDCRNLAIEHVPFDLRAAGLELLVVDSHARHRHVENEYTDRQRACQDAARLLGVPALRDVEDLDAALSTLTDPVLRRRVRHVVTENARVLAAVADLRDGRLRDIGPLLTDSHASMRDDYEITVPEVDLVVEVALANGGYGARMTGGGFGGCVLALVDAGTSDDVAAAVFDAFARRGYAAPSSFVAYPSAGASRVA